MASFFEFVKIIILYRGMEADETAHTKRQGHMINKKGRFVMFPIETISARMLDYYVGRNDALIIDLREEKAYAESHVRGAVNIPYETLENRKDLPMNKILLL